MIAASPDARLEAAADLIARLVEVLDDRMTPAGHPYALVMSEHRGTCPHNACSLRCQEYRALFTAAWAWLNEETP